MSMPANFIFLLIPNSLAALIEFTVSPPAFAKPNTCALEFCACNKNEEKSEAASGCLTEPNTRPPLAFTTSEASFSSDIPNT